MPMSIAVRSVWCVVLFLALSASVQAQNLLTNSGFEFGSGAPSSWELPYGSGTWENFAHTGNKSVSLTSPIVSSCGYQWRTSQFPIEPDKTYLVNVWAYSDTPPNLRAQVGIANINHYSLVERYLYPDQVWQKFSFPAIPPSDMAAQTFRLVSCNGLGKLYFDDLEVLPVSAAHVVSDGLELGINESIRSGLYSYASNLRDLRSKFYIGNYSRCLYRHTAGFNNYYYWILSQNTYMTFRHGYAGRPFTNGVATITATYQSGPLYVDFSGDGTNWITGTNYVAPSSGYISLTLPVAVPPVMLPTTNVYVRVRTDAAGYYYLYGYQFDARMPSATVDAEGGTWFFGKTYSSPFVSPTGLTSDQGTLSVGILNTNAVSRNYRVSWTVTGAAGEKSSILTNQVAAGASNNIPLSITPAGTGENSVQLDVTDLSNGAKLFSGAATFLVSPIHDSSYGYRLPSPTNAAVWWCESTYKVGRTRALPAVSNQWVSVSAARNEYEPFQVVLNPSVNLSNVSASISDFVSLSPSNSASISSTNVELCVVGYVPVTEPSDIASATGPHPDPLPPFSYFTQPITFFAASNQPIWATVYVPKDTPAGDYQATLTINSSAGPITAPVRLHVFNFALTDVTHCHMDNNVFVNDYWWGTSNDAQRLNVYSLFMDNFRKHRITARVPQLYSDMAYSYTSTTNGLQFNYDFRAFDDIMSRYLDEYNFTSFSLSVVPYSLNGYPRFSGGYQDVYKQLVPPIMQHVREQGWFNKAYCFWYDEPNESSFDFVVQGMKLIQAASPGLKRFLTYHIVPAFYGHVDIWVPFTMWLDPSLIPVRQSYGEEVWWYVATVPKYPFPNNLIDMPAYQHRVRNWMAEKMNIAGDHYWNVAWYAGSNSAPVSPWTNTMSRLWDGFGLGNGDGVLLYPPVGTTPPVSPVYAPPINSLRWEVIRESVEDREYFWWLKQLIQRSEPSLGTNHPAIVEARAAIDSALSMIRSVTDYDQDPQLLYTARTRIANAIQALDTGVPTIVRHPTSRAIQAGSNTVLRAEVIGWPMPSYQWQHEGTNYPGATAATLTLTNFNAMLLGKWRLVASNAVGIATSDSANLAGYWVTTPQIINQTIQDLRRTADRTVLEITAVSSLPITYRWYLDGNLVVGATNNTLSITNLIASQAGTYTVVASNQAGVATSGPIALSVMPDYFDEYPLFSGRWAGRTNGFQLNLGVDNRQRWVLVSTNLTTWTTQFQVAPSGLPQTLLDTTATNHAKRFYRVNAN